VSEQNRVDFWPVLLGHSITSKRTRGRTSCLAPAAKSTNRRSTSTRCEQARRWADRLHSTKLLQSSSRKTRNWKPDFHSNACFGFCGSILFSDAKLKLHRVELYPAQTVLSRYGFKQHRKTRNNRAIKTKIKLISKQPRERFPPNCMRRVA